MTAGVRARSDQNEQNLSDHSPGPHLFVVFLSSPFLTSWPLQSELGGDTPTPPSVTRTEMLQNGYSTIPNLPAVLSPKAPLPFPQVLPQNRCHLQGSLSLPLLPVIPAALPLAMSLLGGIPAGSIDMSEAAHSATDHSLRIQIQMSLILPQPLSLV